MDRIHHDPQYRIDQFLRLFRIKLFDEFRRASDVREEDGHLLSFSFQGMSRRHYFFSAFWGNVRVRRGRSLDDAGYAAPKLINGLPAASAKLGLWPVVFATFRTCGFEAHAALVAKNRLKVILGLTLRANHNGNQSQLGCSVPNSTKSELSVHSEGSKQCIVLGYTKSKLKDELDY